MKGVMLCMFVIVLFALQTEQKMILGGVSKQVKRDRALRLKRRHLNQEEKGETGELGEEEKVLEKLNTEHNPLQMMKLALDNKLENSQTSEAEESLQKTINEGQIADVLGPHSDHVLTMINDLQNQYQGSPVIIIDSNPQKKETEKKDEFNSFVQEEQLHSQHSGKAPDFSKLPYYKLDKNGQYQPQFDTDMMKGYASYRLKHLQYSKSYLEANKITSDDIETLVEIISSIPGIYEAYYKILPNEGDEDKSTFEQTVNVLQFYKQLRTFVKVVWEDRGKLIDEIKFLRHKISFLHVTEEDMLRFYSFEQEYFKAKGMAAKFEHKDPKFKQNLQDIKNLVLTFEMDVKIIVDAGNDLEKLDGLFDEDLKELQAIGTVDSVLEGLEAFDKVIMFVNKLLDVKDELEHSLDAMKSAFLNLKSHRTQIQTAMLNIEKLYDFYSINELNTFAGQTKSFTGLIASSCVTLLLIIW